MRKSREPTLYLDTNILSILHYRGSDITCLAQQLVTRNWWDTEREYFSIYGSRFTELELSRGEYLGQFQALAEACRLRYLRIIKQVDACAQQYLDFRIVPKSKPGDATQPAIATVNRVDYLLTWNQAHLANVEIQDRLKEVNARLGLRSPIITTPDLIPKVNLGQSIRRRDG